jgi:hypothetical protein
MEPKGSLPCSHKPTTGPYLDSTEYQFAPSIPISLRYILMLSSHLRLGLPSGLLPSVFQPKPCQHFHHACHMSRPPHPPSFNHPRNQNGLCYPAEKCLVGWWVTKLGASVYLQFLTVGTALGYGLDDRGSRVRFPTGAGNFSLHHRVQNGSGAHPASYPMGTWGFFPGDKAAGAWRWLLTSV